MPRRILVNHTEVRISPSRHLETWWSYIHGHTLHTYMHTYSMYVYTETIKFQGTWKLDGLSFLMVSVFWWSQFLDGLSFLMVSVSWWSQFFMYFLTSSSMSIPWHIHESKWSFYMCVYPDTYMSQNEVYICAYTLTHTWVKMKFLYVRIPWHIHESKWSFYMCVYPDTHMSHTLIWRVIPWHTLTHMTHTWALTDTQMSQNVVSMCAYTQKWRTCEYVQYSHVCAGVKALSHTLYDKTWFTCVW